MHLAINGLWVAWKPDMAPQAMLTNIIGKIGRPEGCWSRRPSVNSGKAGCLTNNITNMPTAMNSSAIANKG